MTLQLLIDGIDRTSVWRVYESRWTQHAWMGQSGFSEFILEDADGTISHDDLAARKIVEVWEDASGSSVCMYHGRISNKQLGLGVHYAPGQAMRWTVQSEDFNVELRGIRVYNFNRSEEAEEVRVEALRLAYLDGAASNRPEARNSTDLDGNFITVAVPVTVQAEEYNDTDPLGVLSQVAEQTGRNFFVYLTDDGDGELAYIDRQDDTIASDIAIVDDAEDEGADGVDIFAAYKTPTAGDHAGQDVYTGGAVRYGDGSYYEESDVTGTEATYDKWETTVTNDFIVNDAYAQNFLNRTILAADESFSYIASIDMRPEDAHRIRAGMKVSLIRKRANKTERLVGPRGDGDA